MLWPGTLIGVAAGWALASIPGAMLGGLLGQVLDRRLQLRSWRDVVEHMRSEPPLADEELLFVLLGRLAKSRGRVLDAHIQQARAEMLRLRLDEPAKLRAIEAFGRGKSGGEQMEAGLLHLKEQRHAAEGLIQACWRMAWAAGAPGMAEKSLILRWGEALGLPRGTVLAMAAGAESARQPEPSAANSYPQALRVLGVTAASEPAEIKRAYRRLLNQHHPDKLAGSDASASRIAAATEKTREIQAAYAVVRQRRGFR
ncbi:DnaJ domain-containing protein [Pseudomonas schmalbachii]|uniref:DnaJ domain-containing protein n=1 Tax=Pseudomonas schmalbachii TaxID=2816993 RepID=A0ABS3TXZ0_9PSED|nr:DnaJ domain-containing protein [Pseudomonas schmalbachii]MBO3277560.1 DnaJ domain-containing protein [Pseudomonas schmalbachii]